MFRRTATAITPSRWPTANGDVSLACGELNGYVCPGDVNLVIAGASVVTNFTIQACSALQILTTSPLPAGQVGSYYDIFLQASSCYPDFSWAITSGSLPPGLTGNPFTGELYGSPLTNGTWVFTVQVTDGNSAMTNTVCSLTIASPATGRGGVLHDEDGNPPPD